MKANNMIERFSNLRKNKNEFEKQIQNLSADTFLDFLVNLNRQLRDVDENNEVLDENMEVGNLKSPTKEVQRLVMNDLIEGIKMVKEPKLRAAMTYYTLLDLHMFDNGNGRTARFMYDLFSGQISSKESDYYFHKRDSGSGNYNISFEESRKIEDVTIATQYINEKLIETVQSEIPENMREKYITVSYSNSTPDITQILSQNILNELDIQEINDLRKIIQDSYGQKLTPSGYAMLRVANQKGELEKWESLNKELDVMPELNRMNFWIYKHPEMLANWTADDFRNVINYGNSIKRMQFQCLIEAFKNPERDLGFIESVFKESVTNEQEREI